MQNVSVTLRSRDTDCPPFPTQGVAPSADCSLCVCVSLLYDFATKEWRRPGMSVEFVITHRATGYSLGKKTWSTQADALAALDRCDPAFPGWQFATGAGNNSGLTCAATKACQQKYKLATE